MGPHKDCGHLVLKTPLFSFSYVKLATHTNVPTRDASEIIRETPRCFTLCWHVCPVPFETSGWLAKFCPFSRYVWSDIDSIQHLETSQSNLMQLWLIECHFGSPRPPFVFVGVWPCAVGKCSSALMDHWNDRRALAGTLWKWRECSPSQRCTLAYWEIVKWHCI